MLAFFARHLVETEKMHVMKSAIVRLHIFILLAQLAACATLRQSSNISTHPQPTQTEQPAQHGFYGGLAGGMGFGQTPIPLQFMMGIRLGYHHGQRWRFGLSFEAPFRSYTTVPSFPTLSGFEYLDVTVQTCRMWRLAFVCGGLTIGSYRIYIEDARRGSVMLDTPWRFSVQAGAGMRFPLEPGFHIELGGTLSTNINRLELTNGSDTFWHQPLFSVTPYIAFTCAFFL